MNLPAPGDRPRVNKVIGALDIQEYFERLEWLNANHAAGAFMEYLRSKPINGPARPVLIQMARGDRTTVNPSVAEGIRAADARAAAARLLADRVTLFRWDLFPGRSPSADPHTFLTATDIARDIALQAQEQIAVFYNSNGTETIDPDGAGPLFETPAATVPTDFGFVFP